MFFLRIPIKNRVFVDRKLYISDPDSNHKNIRVIISSNYLGGGIPMYPYGRRIYEVFDANDQLIPQQEWTPVIEAQIKECKKDVKGAWKLYSFPIILVSFICITLGANQLIELYKKQVIANQKALILDPRENDLIFYYGYERTDKETVMRPSKITKISGDTIFLQFGDLKEPITSTAVGTKEAIIDAMKADGLNLTERTIAIKKKDYLRGNIKRFGKDELSFSYNDGFIERIDR